MRVLFLTRKFPPQKGGMQKTAYELFHSLSGLAEVKLVRWGGANKWLPLILPYFLLSSIYLMTVAKVDIIYIHDGLLAPLGYLLKVFRKPVLITIYGLDITYKNRFYQFLVPRCVRRLDRVICISQAAVQECVKRGIPQEKITVIPVGVSDEFYMGLKGVQRGKLREEVSQRLGFDLGNKRILLSVGRLIERKGFHWFVEDVMPKIMEQDENWVYLIVGDGIYRERIQNAIARTSLSNHVLMLGQVDDETLKKLYNVADVYAMPNVPVEGDLEGFGVVILEASSCGLPVVASALEGIEDAVKDRETGLLLEPRNAEEFASAILRLPQSDDERENFGKAAREFTLKNYGWDQVAKRYLDEFRKALESRKVALLDS